MAKVSNEDRHQYFERIKPYKAAISAHLKKEELLLQAVKQDPQTAASRRLVLANEMILLTSNYIIQSGVSLSMLKLRSEEALNEGRKSLYKAVIYLEDVVSPMVDAPYSEYENRLAEIASVDAAKRYSLIRKMGLVIQLLENAYGDNTKWRWSFVELEGRFAAIVKNIVDLKSAVSNTDPRSPDYEPTMYHLRLMKKLLAQAADRYREKYELSTNHIDDFKMGLNFLNALKRIHILLGDRNDAETVKKRAETWAAKLDLDIKKKKEER